MLLMNQMALITGSGRGIGRAMAQLFARKERGILMARTEKELAKTVADITAAGDERSFLSAISRTRRIAGRLSTK